MDILTEPSEFHKSRVYSEDFECLQFRKQSRECSLAICRLMTNGRGSSVNYPLLPSLCYCYALVAFSIVQSLGFIDFPVAVYSLFSSSHDEGMTRNLPSSCPGDRGGATPHDESRSCAARGETLRVRLLQMNVLDSWLRISVKSASPGSQEMFDGGKVSWFDRMLILPKLILHECLEARLTLLNT